MRVSPSSVLALAAIIGSAAAHPEKHEHNERASHAPEQMGIRSTDKCAAKLAARREIDLERRREKLHQRRSDAGIQAAPLEDRNIFSTIQNDTCVLSVDTIFGPYGVDGELHRHDVREDEEGFDLYLDIGVIDVETCEPLSNAWLTIWSCNATGTYAGYTGVDPDTVEVMDGWTSRDDGTTDDTTFLRGISKTDGNGMTEFLTIFPGYYSSRTTHIHVTVQADVTGTNTSYSAADIQHVGQLFFEEDLINSVYELAPYAAHKLTLNRTTNAEDSIYSSASSNGYSAVIDVTQLGATLEDGFVGYITIGVNSSAAAVATTGQDVNMLGVIPTVSLTSGAQYAAATKDAAEGYEAYYKKH